MRKSTTSRGFGIIEALIGILILGLVVGGTVRTVQAIRAHEAATEAYSQDQSQIKANADLVTGGNIVVSSGADGIKYMAAAGDASTPVKTKVIFSNNDGVGVVDELVQMENAKGWLAVGAVSRLEDKPETVVPDTSTLTLAVNPVQVNVGEGYSVSWTSTGMERVIVQELNEAGASVEFGNTLSNTGKTTSKSVAGTYTYKATGYYKGGTKAAVAQVKVIKPFAGDMDIDVAEYATGPWSKAISIAPNPATGSASYYVRFMHKGFDTVQITRDGGQIATQTVDDRWDSLAQTGTPGRTYVYRIVATDGGKTYTAEATVTVANARMWATALGGSPVITEIPVNQQFLVHYEYYGFPVATATFLRDFPNGSTAGDGFIFLDGSHAGTTNTFKEWGRSKGYQRIYASNVAGMMNFALVNGNTAAPQYASCRVNVIAPTTGTITANPSSVKLGAGSNISWTATGPVTVRRTTPSGQVTAAWGASSGNSSKWDGPYQETGSYRYDLIGNDTGNVIDTAYVTVGQDVGKTPSVWIRANRVKSASVQNGQYYTIEWGSGNVSSATESGPGLSESSVSGSKQIKATSNGTFTYTIRSTDGSNKTDSCKVTVSASNGSPWVSIAASATRVRVNEAYTISWQSGNCTSVAVSGPGLSSNKFSGTSAPISQARTGTYTYTITGQPGNVTDSVSVIVEAARAGGGGGSVEIWSDKESPYHTVTQGDPFMVGWKSSGESGVTVEGWKPQNVARVGDFNPAKKTLSGNQGMQTTESRDVWPEGDYTFTITGNSGASDSCTVKVIKKPTEVAMIIPRTASAPMYDMWDVIWTGSTYFDTFDQPRDRKPNNAVGYIADSIAKRMPLYQYAKLRDWIIFNVIIRPPYKPQFVSYGPESIPLVEGGSALVSADVRWEKTSPIDNRDTSPMYYEASTNTFYGLNCIVTVYGLSTTMYP